MFVVSLRKFFKPTNWSRPNGESFNCNGYGPLPCHTFISCAKSMDCCGAVDESGAFWVSATRASPVLAQAQANLLPLSGIFLKCPHSKKSILQSKFYFVGIYLYIVASIKMNHNQNKLKFELYKTVTGNYYKKPFKYFSVVLLWKKRKSYYKVIYITLIRH